MAVPLKVRDDRSSGRRDVLLSLLQLPSQQREMKGQQ